MLGSLSVFLPLKIKRASISFLQERTALAWSVVTLTHHLPLLQYIQMFFHIILGAAQPSCKRSRIAYKV